MASVMIMARFVEAVIVGAMADVVRSVGRASARLQARCEAPPHRHCAAC